MTTTPLPPSAPDTPEHPWQQLPRDTGVSLTDTLEEIARQLAALTARVEKLETR